VLRHPESRERFGALHGRAIEPFVAVTQRVSEERGFPLPDEPHKFTSAMYAMNLGLTLERMTRPDVVDAGLAARMVRLSFEGGVRDGTRLQPQASD
jgi:hypothetical protein